MMQYMAVGVTNAYFDQEYLIRGYGQSDLGLKYAAAILDGEELGERFEVVLGDDDANPDIGTQTPSETPP
jgi:hypothetical protein